MTATSGVPEQGASRSGGPPAPLPGTRWQRAFPGEVRQLSVVRRWLESLLPDGPARDDVACVATELGTNAIRHTASGQGGQFVLDVTWQGSAVRVAVEDSGGAGVPQVIDDPAGEQGRGLLVVQGLSERFGVSGDHRGRTVWAEISWGGAGATAKPAPPQEPYDAEIHDGLADLAARFAGIPAWFGRSTRQWWALVRDGLVSAPSAQELANLLGRIAGSPSPQRPAGRAAGPKDRGTARACGGRRRAGLVVRPVRRLVPGHSGPFGPRPSRRGTAVRGLRPCGQLSF
jgi:anti-sigma regulatory factor (Ser/Thr protein kinase)